jgi:hypothetical protein
MKYTLVVLLLAGFTSGQSIEKKLPASPDNGPTVTTDLPDLQRTFIPKLSILVSDWDDELKPLLRKDSNDSGVVVIAQGAPSNGGKGITRGARRLVIQYWVHRGTRRVRCPSR